MNRYATLSLAAPLLAALLAGCATPPPVISADIKPTTGNNVSGTVVFASAGEGVAVTVKLQGLTRGEHGFHVHEKGDCSAPDAMSAGGHWNPAAMPHGPQSGPHHMGDMPLLTADARGNVDTSFLIAGTPSAFIGHAVVVHADADDYKTQPTGNSGGRVGCGVIEVAKK